MKLLIVIPALNEEQSITDIIERSLAAVDTIITQSPVTEVDVTVVSDGSTDRTAERAAAFGDRIHLITFERNRGYGAAIMAGWQSSDADLLAFLDADGTCDPLFFAELCNCLDRERVDVVLGCRLNHDSRMPLVRRIGNILFAVMLRVFSATRVRDVASGMRVIRRSCLPRLLPLPEGLHFTPAMSARALLSNELKIAEIDMPYLEREGRSKLSPVRDGLRFLRVIVQTALLYRPSRPLGLVAMLLLLIAAALMIMPAAHYFRHGEIIEWMIYRFVACDLCVVTACLLLCAGYLGRRVADMSLTATQEHRRDDGLLGMLFTARWFWWLPCLLIVIGAWLVKQGLTELVSTGHVYEHWSRVIACSTLLAVAIMLSVTRLLNHGLDMLAGRLWYLRSLKEG